jgi:uncharacterized membrane protein YphA (DoxX/SURF4 family)
VNLVGDYFRELYRAALAGWNRFWFTPSDVATLAMVRIFAGAMLLYTHAVWTIGLDDFFGANSWISPEAARALQPDDNFVWSYFWLIRSPAALWAAHIAALVVFALLTVGLFTRFMSVLAFLISVAYVNRVPSAQFGLDQINVMLAMYLMIGPSGAAYSLDRLWARRRQGRGGQIAPPSVSANLAIRLIQVHMCVIYFFAGIAKLQGETWWMGDALWGAVANLEYQTLDVTWLAKWPILLALITHLTVFWEMSFCVLVWPRLTRPLVLALAVPLHLGIAFCMGMITFGLVMLIGCLSFVSPALVRRLIERRGESLDAAAGQGRAGADKLAETLPLTALASRKQRDARFAAPRKPGG